MCKRDLLSCVLLLILAGQSRAGVKLTESADDGRVFSVRCRLKVEGQIQSAGLEGKPQNLKTGVDGKLSFLERRLPAGGREAEAFRSVRYYELAEADIQVADRKTLHRLEDTARVIVAEGKRDGVRSFALTGPLANDSIDLLRTPGDSLTLLALLPAQEIDSGSSWKPDPWVMPTLTGVEAVSESDLTCRIEKLDRQFAVIQVDGRISGAVLGAATKITIGGKIAFDLQKNHIRQAVLTQTEERAIGAVSPGINVKATMYVDKALSGVSGPLSEKLMADVPINPEAYQLAIRFDAPWGVRLIHDRNWHVFHQNQEIAVLRLVENGSLLTQCNLAQISAVAPGDHTPLEQFTSDIRLSLGTSLKEVSNAEESKTADGLFLYRVTAVGQVRNVPMHWFYYLCAAPDGRQTSLVFAVESSLVGQLGNRDRELVENLTFVTRPTASASR